MTYNEMKLREALETIQKIASPGTASPMGALWGTESEYALGRVREIANAALANKEGTDK